MKAAGAVVRGWEFFCVRAIIYKSQSCKDLKSQKLIEEKTGITEFQIKSRGKNYSFSSGLALMRFSSSKNCSRSFLLA